MTIIDCPNIAGAKAPVLNTPLSQWVEIHSEGSSLFLFLLHLHFHFHEILELVSKRDIHKVHIYFVAFSEYMNFTYNFIKHSFMIGL